MEHPKKTSTHSLFLQTYRRFTVSLADNTVYTEQSNERHFGHKFCLQIDLLGNRMFPSHLIPVAKVCDRGSEKH